MELFQQQSDSLRVHIKVVARSASPRDVQRPAVVAAGPQEFDEMDPAPCIRGIILERLP